MRKPILICVSALMALVFVGCGAHAEDPGSPSDVDVDMEAKFNPDKIDSPRELAKRIDKLLSGVSSQQLGQLVANSNCVVALAAGWERVHRSIPNAERSIPYTERQEVLRPAGEAVSRFLGLVEGRLQVAIPNVWEEAVKSARENDQGDYSFRGMPRESKARQGAGEVAVSLRREGDRWIVATGTKTLQFPARPTMGRVTDAMVKVNGETAYVALYGWPPRPYRLYAVEHSTGKIVWSSEVWAEGALVLHQGPGSHYVEMELSGNRLAVYGFSEVNAYVEVFDIRTGRNECRFSTSHVDAINRKMVRSQQENGG